MTEQDLVGEPQGVASEEIKASMEGGEQDVPESARKLTLKKEAEERLRDQGDVTHIKERAPVRTKCPSCGFEGMTVVKKKMSGCGKASCCLMTLVCLCWIPLCMKSCRVAIHECQACSAVIAKV